MLDLAAIPAVDVHCHPWRDDACLALDPSGFEDRITMMGMCQLTSGSSAQIDAAIREMTEATPLALAMRRRLGRFLGVPSDRNGVAQARHEAYAADPAAYLHRLMADARVSALFCDEGFPQPTIDLDGIRAGTGVTVHRVGRIEPWIAELAPSSGSYPELEDAMIARLEKEAGDPQLRAFKSVIAYRTGLDVSRPERGDVEAAFARWRADGFRESREHAKPIRDLLLRRTIEVAGRAGVPVHIHCGGGDPDVVLPHARPSGLYELLSEYADVPVVLIHSGWPWVEEAGFIASILPAVFLDISVLLPWSSLALDQKLEVLLGAVPTNKVMYGSDEASEPEVIWFSAHLGRSALGRVLSRAVEHEWLDEAEAMRIARGVMGANALRLHGLSADG